MHTKLYFERLCFQVGKKFETTYCKAKSYDTANFHIVDGGNHVICMPQREFTTLDAKAAGCVGKFMTEAAAAQLLGDNGMNLWHGVAP